MSEITIIEIHELENLVRNTVVEAIKQELPATIARATAKPLLTKKELMALTGWSSRTVEYRKASAKIPYIRRGRTVLFKTDDVYQYFEDGYVQAKGEGEKNGKW